MNQRSKIGFWFTVLIFGFWILSCNCYAQTVSSRELINNVKQYDGQRVIYTGEVIGDVMARGEYAWVNLNDGSNAIGVWLPKVAVKDISYKGSYKSKGDIVEISGIFWRSCQEHGGDLDIHAQAVRKINNGYQLAESVYVSKLGLAFSLAIVMVLTWIFNLLNRHLKPRSGK